MFGFSSCWSCSASQAADQDLLTQLPQLLQNSSKSLQGKIKQSQQSRAMWIIPWCWGETSCNRPSPTDVHLFLKTSNDCTPPAYIGSLLLSLSLIVVGKFVLISNLNLPCFQLNLLRLVPLSVDIKATDFQPLYSDLWRLLSCSLQTHPSSLH